MPDLTGPLLSLDASGTLAKTITYSHWRGIKYARQRVIPSNPNTTPQQDIRTVFANLARLWKYGDPTLWDSFQAAATGHPYTDRNLWVRLNAGVLYAGGLFLQATFAAQTHGAPGPNIIGSSPVAGELHLAVTDPTLPSGWAVDTRLWYAIREQDPRTTVNLDPILTDTSAAGVTTQDFTGLPTGQTWIGAAATKYTTNVPNQFAYSYSSTVGTPIS